ncbi:MAG: phosphatidylglycerol lysyltransferase domain-containing protein [Clostridia bacterium]|nr:phosphatidylglycerol lysyltransferase domain-containing protein [Clostridia bacterium]
MNFKPFTEENIELLSAYLKDSGYAGSDFSYYGYLIWFDTEYAEEDDCLFIRAFFGDKLRYWPPLTKGSVSFLEALSRLPEDCTFTSFTKDKADLLSDRFQIFTKRDWSEYIYDAGDFIRQEGSKYSGKRNHIKKFRSLYSFEMRPFSESDREDILKFEKAWLEGKVFDTEYQKISAEEESGIIVREAEASLKGNTICDVLRIDGKLAGFTIGEIMASGNAVVTVEKADTSFEGIYSFLSHEFAVRHFSGCRYINRQEDMGIEGLRKSKLSYNPAFLIDKYVLIHNDAQERMPVPCFDDDPFFNPSVNISNISESSWLTDEIKTAGFEDYELRELASQDFNRAMSFYKCGISKLSDKKWFMNFTDDELEGVLENGHMFGLFYKNHLVCTCCADEDEAYGLELKNICGDERDIKYFEFSGIMTCPYHQKKGLSNYLCQYVINFVSKTMAPCVLCAVVQFDNIPSLKNLEKLGFKETARKKKGGFDFIYLTLEIQVKL